MSNFPTQNFQTNRLFQLPFPTTRFQVMKFHFEGFDENGNGILDGQETVNWNKTIEQTIASSFHPEIIAAVKRAWTDSQLN